MPHRVETDHQIVAFDPDRMALIDNATGSIIVTANRVDGQWTVHADGADDVTVGTRPEAITALTEHALAICDGDGFTTLVPHGLSEQP